MLGDWIRTQRKARKLSQQELATLVGVSQVQISGWETNKHTPSERSLELLEHVIGSRPAGSLAQGLPAPLSSALVPPAPPSQPLASPSSSPLPSVPAPSVPVPSVPVPSGPISGPVLSPRTPAVLSKDSLLLRLMALEEKSANGFYARRDLLQRIETLYEEADGLPTLIGARIRLMAHQLYAVRRVLTARTPRFILADEVGLGKTIEAGLIIQALMAAEPELPVLVIAPGSMSRQWLCELYLRVGARPFQVAKDLKAVVGTQVIVSTSTLSRQPSLWGRLTSRRWGMVVIDEAHHHAPGTPLYQLYQDLSLACDGMLVLSATPSKREVKGILGLLALVAPEQYSISDEKRVEALWESRREIWDRLGYQQSLRESPDFADMPAAMFADIAGEWEPLLANDEAAAPLLARLKEGERNAFDELEAYVQEHYRVDHRIIRTRRKTVLSLGQKWCERTCEVVEYPVGSAEALLVTHVEEKLPQIAALDGARRALVAAYLRLLRLSPRRCQEGLKARLLALQSGQAKNQGPQLWDELLSDPSPDEEARLHLRVLTEVAPFEGEVRWLEHAERLAASWCQEGPLGSRHRCAMDWIERHLRDKPHHKLLVFTEDREVARAFAEELGRRIGKQVDAFHWVDSEQDEERLKQITTDFQRKPTRPVLVSDELGGEGRNFQMAEAVLHLDCPWAVARVEQRIGRLDRIGREANRPVKSVVFLGASKVEREIHTLHDEVFGVYRHSIGGLEFLLPDLQRRIFHNAVAGAATMSEARAELTTKVRTALDEAEQEFDQSIDTSRHELEEAQSLTKLLEENDGTDLQAPIKYWARTLGLHTEEVAYDGFEEFKFQWIPDDLPLSLPGRWGNSSRRQDAGTFNREEALERENMQFFALGHRLIDAQIQMLHLAPTGNLTVFRRHLGSAHQGKVFAMILVHFDLDPAMWSQEPFDASLLTRARRRLTPQLIERSVQLGLPGSDEPEIVKDMKLKGHIEAEFDSKQIQSLDPSMIVAHARPLAEAVQRALQLAIDDAGLVRASFANAASKKLQRDLATEIAFLSNRSQRNSEEAREALRQRRLLLSNIDKSRASVAGVAVIFGT